MDAIKAAGGLSRYCIDSHIWHPSAVIPHSSVVIPANFKRESSQIAGE